MIKKALNKPLTLHELYNKVELHTLRSLEVELRFLQQIGVVSFEDGKYFYKLK